MTIIVSFDQDKETKKWSIWTGGSRRQWRFRSKSEVRSFATGYAVGYNDAVQRIRWVVGSYDEAIVTGEK